jgi:hypothetical protein
MSKSLILEEQDIYLVKIEETAAPIEDEAVKRFEFAYQKARQFRVSNQWTAQILKSLNQYKPSEYPTFKKEKRLEVKGLRTTSQFILPKKAKDLIKSDQSTSPAPSSNSQEGSKESTLPNNKQDQTKLKSTLGQKKIKQPKSSSPKESKDSSSDSSSDVEDLDL